MKNYAYGTIIFAMLALAGCSDVGFESVPKLSCKDLSRDQYTDCETNPKAISVSFTFRVGEVDILVVNDNSGSMFPEQRKMADAFPNLFNRISNLFFRIGIITTDVSATAGNTTPRAANGFGAFQDGKLLEFTYDDGQRTASGLKYIDQNTPDGESLFRGTIQRRESLDCDQSGYDVNQCPSQDERGIYAANLAIDRGEAGFFRPGSHTAILILSDEDERGKGYQSQSGPMESYDLPETLVKNFVQKYPTKSLSVHSVVTNNETCLGQQLNYSQGRITRGSIGEQYMLLSSPAQQLLDIGNLVSGSVGSICDSNYATQLYDIGSYVQNNTLNSPKKRACENPTAQSIVTSPTGYENQITMSIDSENRVTFGNLPIGVSVTYTYDCPRY
jgi:hypothetical protein